MLTIQKHAYLQEGDIFKWRNPLYSEYPDSKLNMPENIQFLAGYRPAIVTKVTRNTVTFYPFQSALRSTTQVNLNIVEPGFECKLHNGINSIKNEIHEVSKSDFNKQIDYYICSLKSKMDLKDIQQALDVMRMSYNIPSINIPNVEIECLRAGNIIRAGNTRFIVMSKEDKITCNVCELTFVTNNGVKLHNGDDSYIEYIDFNSYKQLKLDNSFEIRGYVEEDKMPAIYHEFTLWQKNKIEEIETKMHNMSVDMKLRSAVERAMNIISDALSNKEELPNVVDAVVEEPKQEIVTVTSFKPVIEQNKPASTFTVLDQNKSLQDLKSKLEKKEENDLLAKLTPEMKELQSSNLWEYFRPVNGSSIFSQINTPQQLLMALRESYNDYAERTGHTRPQFYYYRGLIVKSIDHRLAPELIRKYL